jgi:hypothetical protein
MPEATLAATEADLLCTGYALRYFNDADIERWADEQIAATDHPSDTLLDLSILSQTNPVDILKLLNKIRGEFPADLSIRNRIGLIGVCFQQNRLTLKDAVAALFALTHDDGTSERQKSAIYFLERVLKFSFLSLRASWT